MKIVKNIMLFTGFACCNCFAASSEHVIKFEIFKPNREIVVDNLRLNSSQSVDSVRSNISKKYFNGEDVIFYTSGGEIIGDMPITDKVNKFKSVYVWSKQKNDAPPKEVVLKSIDGVRVAIKNFEKVINNFEGMMRTDNVQNLK